MESKEKTNVYWNNPGISLRGNGQVRFSQEEACQGDTDVRPNTWVCARATAQPQVLVRSRTAPTAQWLPNRPQHRTDRCFQQHYRERLGKSREVRKSLTGNHDEPPGSKSLESNQTQTQLNEDLTE